MAKAPAPPMALTMSTRQSVLPADASSSARLTTQVTANAAATPAANAGEIPWAEGARTRRLGSTASQMLALRTIELQRSSYANDARATNRNPDGQRRHRGRLIRDARIP